MGRRQIFFGVLVVLALSAGTALYLRGADIPVLQPHGPVAAGEQWVLIFTVLMCSIVVVPVFIMLFSFAWMFRADRPRSRRWHMPDWDHYTTEVELIWWLIPTIIIAVLAGVAWRSSHELDPYNQVGEGAPMVIQVVALDWKWLFIYPEQGIASVNMVEFPANTPVRFELTADAPMNSFWIPSLAGQIMVMPGMTTQLHLLANDTGVFRGLSGNLSGAGFSGMTFDVHAVPQSDFDAWVSSVRTSTSSSLTSDSYAALAAPSSNTPVSFFRSIDTTVYDQVSMKYMTPDHEMMSLPESGVQNTMHDMRMMSPSFNP